jgi:microsomal epoxide hydrolase
VPRSFRKEAVYATGRPLLYVVRPKWEGQAGNLAAHRPNTETAIMRGVGHALFVDDPARFNAVVESFIRQRVWP